MSKKEKGVSLKEAMESYNWRVIPISELPDDSPVIGISQYASKAFAEFNLVENVIVPVFPVENKPPTTMNSLNQDTLKLIEEELSSKVCKISHIQAVMDCLTNPKILKSAGLYTLQEMQTQMLNLLEKEEEVSRNEWAKVNRVEIIDDKGRSYVKYFNGKVEQSLQDERRTLKIFITPTPPNQNI